MKILESHQAKIQEEKEILDKAQAKLNDPSINLKPKSEAFPEEFIIMIQKDKIGFLDIGLWWIFLSTDKVPEEIKRLAEAIEAVSKVEVTIQPK